VSFEFPSISADKLLKILKTAPLNYEIVRTRGSHRVLKSKSGYKQLVLALHNKSVSPKMVKNILIKDIGLQLDEAKELFK
jgi:predicted RNA binding protein YcfA (HicA-like mRNA interferase family)